MTSPNNLHDACEVLGASLNVEADELVFYFQAAKKNGLTFMEAMRGLELYLGSGESMTRILNEAQKLAQRTSNDDES